MKLKRFFIRRKIKNLPPLTPRSLIPLNAEEDSFIKAIRQEHMKRTGCQPEDFTAYFADFHIKHHKTNCRAVAIRQLRRIEL